MIRNRIYIRTILGSAFNITLMVIIGIILILNFYENKWTIEYVEDNEIKSELDNTIKHLNNINGELEKWAIDYAVWDDTYRTMTDSENFSTFMTENFDDWIPEYLGVNSIFVLDHEGNLRFEHNSNPNLLNYIKSSPFFTEALNTNTYNYITKFNGIFEFENRIYQIAASPILKSNSTGPNRGLLIYVKEVNEELIFSLKEVTELDFYIAHPSGFFIKSKSIEHDFSELINFNHILKSNKTITTKSYLIDIFGLPCAIIGVQKDRLIYEEIRAILLKISWIILIISSMVLVFLRLALNHYVIVPLKNMENQLSIMNQSDSLSHLLIKGPVELSHFTDLFNQLVDKLANAKSEKDALTLLSNVDDLTGAFTHRFIFEHFDIIEAEAKHDVSVILIDVDRFKSVNTAVGYHMGDLYLRRIAFIVNNCVKHFGNVFRYSGEMFLVLVPDLSMSQVYNLSECIRKEIEQDIYFKEHKLHFPITASIGLAKFPQDGFDLEEVLNNAESAVKYSKIKGRNQITVFTEEIKTSYSPEQLDEFQAIERMVDSVMAMSEAIDSKDSYTGKHSHSVAEISVLLANKLGLTQKEKNDLRIGALLHDTGKIGLSDSLLHKKNQLTTEEFEIIKSHPVLGHNIVKHFVKTQDILSCIRNHHERYDGKGYPDQLTGKDTPLFARIVSAADAYHAMASDRPYREALDDMDIIKELKVHSGKQFDPFIAEKLIELIECGELKYLRHPDGIDVDHYDS